MRLLYPTALLLLIVVPLLATSLLRHRHTPWPRRVIPLAIRAFAVAAVVLAIAGTESLVDEPGVDIVFVVDVSDSVGPDGAALAQRFVDRTLARTAPEDRAAILLVADGVAVERRLQPGLTRLTRESVLDTGATTLADGVLRSLSLLEDRRAARIVLLSDGRETGGDVVAAARVAAEAGVEVSVVPLPARPAEGGVFVRGIDAPAEVRTEEPHEFRVVVAATEARQATITVFRNDRYYGEDLVRLGPGDNVVGFQGRFEEAGIHRYRVVVSAPDLPDAPTNEAEALVRVTGEPAVLYVTRSPAPHAVTALRQQGFSVDVRPVSGIPGDLGGLVHFDAVVFDNVPAYELSLARMEAVERYVRDAGGGFLMIGGDESFGAGGYYRTPIERLLPVDMDITSTMKMPSLAMLFVIDKSGSMGAMEVSGVTRLDLVKEAVVSAVEIMNPYYQVGVIAFDADYEWVVPVTRAEERERIIGDLVLLSPGGGTVLGGALREALQSLRDEEAAVKHIIVLSDGLTADSGFDELIDEFGEESITISTVSVGSTADRAQMQQVAEWGGGRSYHAADPRSVPRIFATETTIMSRNLIVERPFVPQIVARNAVVDGIGADEIPPLEGFVLAYQKPDAQMVLSGVGGNPVLSTRRYGLGRSVAFTSDLRARWAINWIGWQGYPRLIGQMLRWAQRPAGDTTLAVGFETRPGAATRMTVDASEPDGSFRNLLELTARVVPPNGNTFRVALEQTGPGRYEADLPSDRPGEYLVTIIGAADGRPEPYGFSLPYAQEYLHFETDYELLEAVARAGGGTMLGPDDTATALDRPRAGITHRDLGPWLLVAAMALLLVELFVKQIALPAAVPSVPGARRSAQAPPATAGRAPSREPVRRAERRRRPGAAEAVYDDLRRQIADDYRHERDRVSSAEWDTGRVHVPGRERVRNRRQRR